MLMEVEFANEPFNSLVKAGTEGPRIQEVLGEIKPEALYFTNREGSRTCSLVVDVPEPSSVHSLAEPFFLVFDAGVRFNICIGSEDLGKAGLEAIGRKYA
jgi:hypothetical protein